MSYHEFPGQSADPYVQPNGAPYQQTPSPYRDPQIPGWERYYPPQPSYQPSPYQTPPPPQPPKRKRHLIRNVFLGGLGFIVLIVVIVAVTTNTSNTLGSSSGPGPASSPAAPDSTAGTSHTAKAAAFRTQTLLHVSGSGQYTTQKFTVGGNGDYNVYWTYNEGSMGGSVNFDFDADGGNDFNLTGPNQLGTGGSGVTHVYSDAGTHYLSISSEGNWTVKVVTAP